MLIAPPIEAAAALLAQCTALVACRSPLIRRGVSSLLAECEVDVVCEARESEELAQKARTRRPDLIVLCDAGSTSSDVDYLDAIAGSPRDSDPDSRDPAYLIVSNRVDAPGASRLMSEVDAGFGYILFDKVQAVEDFRNTVSRVVHGDSVLDPDVVNEMLGRKFRRDRFANLTTRESEALSLMASGLTNRAIADRMIISTRAAEKHVGSIFEKLGLEPGPDNHRRVLSVLQFLQAQ
jgi:DNA-binding NarL/FixJ family response regulator